MPTPRPTQFQAFEFSADELIQAEILSPLLRMRIQSMLADTAQQVLGLVYDPNHPLEFVQQDANIKGQMAVYQLLLDEDDKARTTIVRQSSGNQS